ncbi:unnamed protein product [Zymoseptoria tritici ST99CH_1E4]|uniref:Uncharacterized protein n=1 Tax=Zymoseptoria tritici ST99CH_1E4 TaxID=1276532 RepID=A0A2H1H4G2_ZYMTR|nr:unnamed protein product [Zymoseptoria tritici ST99CH_1E4]
MNVNLWGSATKLSAILASFMKDAKGLVNGCFTFPAPDGKSLLFGGAYTNYLLNSSHYLCSISMVPVKKRVSRASKGGKREETQPLSLLNRVTQQVRISEIFDDGAGIPDSVTHPTLDDSIRVTDRIVGMLSVPFTFSRNDDAAAYVRRIKSVLKDGVEECRSTLRDQELRNSSESDAGDA